MSLVVRAVARSDVGLVRKTNEDSGYAGPRILAVADGMGGHAAGEVASAIAIETLASLDGPGPSPSPDDGEAQLQEAIARSHGRIAGMIEENEARTGMGTTVTALLWTGAGFDVIHIGDSRAYLLRDGELKQVTHDQTYVQMLLDTGRISEDEIATHPARSLLLQALGGGEQPKPDFARLEARAGDRWLLCSDGLSGPVDDATLAEILRSSSDREQVAEALIDRAVGAGAPDNITVVVADIVESAELPRGRDDTTEVHLVGAASRGAATRADDEPEEEPEEPEDEESLRYRLRERAAPRWLLPGLALLAVAAVGFGGYLLVENWYQHQYYVSVEEDAVVIVQGVASLPGGEVVYAAPDFPPDSLPTVVVGDLEDGISANDPDDARRIVDDLRRQACIANPPPRSQPMPTDELEESAVDDTDAGTGETATDSTPDAAETDTETDTEDEDEPTSSYPGLDCTGVET